MPSVITSEGMRRKATPSPLANPTSAEAPSAIANAPGLLLPPEIWVSRMAARFRFQATDKSMPPVRITSVCPAASTPR